MKYIIFDFDGTIADTFKLFIEISHNLTGHPSLLDPIITEELKHENIVDAAARLGIAKHRWPILLIRGRKQMAKRLDEINPFEGIGEVLSSLHKRDFKMYIMSTNSTSNINSFLSRFGFSEYFQAVYGGVGLLNKAAALTKILKKNDIKTEDAVYIGDEVRDIEAANKVNMKVIAVAWGFNDPERLIKDEPMIIVRTRPALLKVLESFEVR